MPHYYFECLLDGVLYNDEFGIELQAGEIADQARAVVASLLEESTKPSLAVIVTVRTENGHPAHVAHGIIGGTSVVGVPAGASQG